ncbi:MAG: hypothetical protein ACKVH0_00705, partial [Alphaproteobacteria bacterium]
MIPKRRCAVGFDQPQPKGAPMRTTRKVKEILSWYESDSPGTKTKIANI